MQVRPYRGLNNVIDGAVVTFVDISERKQHEQARSRLAAIVESSHDAIISHDLDGTITSWNAGAERLYGYTAAEAIGQSMPKLLDGALPDDWPQVLARLRRGEQIAHLDSTKVAKGGRAIEVSITISPVREGDGRIVGASVVARDISERRAAEQKNALLLGELDHRVKNILAVVSAVVSQTLKTSPDAGGVRRRDPGPHHRDRQGAQPADASRAGCDVAARRDHDGAGAVRARRRRDRHHRRRRRADPEGGAGAGDGGARAGQQRGQVRRAFDDLRPAGGRVEGRGPRRASAG